MILSLPERLADYSAPLYVRASIDLPSAVVSVQVRSDTMAPLKDVVAPGITMALLQSMAAYGQPWLGTARHVLPDMSLVVRHLMSELQVRIAANHVLPASLDGFQGLYDRLPCLCGDLYAPIDSPCEACAVALDHALELGLVEYAETLLAEGAPPYLRWVGETMRGGRVLRGDRGWDWERMREMRDESIWSTAIVAPPYPTRASNRKAKKQKKQRPKKLAHCKRKR